jgi:cytochrome c oxidase subunit 3
VTVGALMLTVMLFRCLSGHFTPEHHFAFEAVAWYWHFVDVVWLGLFIFVYWL